MSSLWVVGDVHGAHDKLRALLILAGLTDRYGRWIGEQAHLVFLGDYLDRGPDGLGVIRLVQALEREAGQAGGQVTALIGNHEVMFLAASRFFRPGSADPTGLYDYWLGNGGQRYDLDRLEPEDIRWLAARPAVARVGGWLLVHADSLFYLQLGGTLTDINDRTRQLLSSLDPATWAAFANAFVGRLSYAGLTGEAQARQLLDVVGGQCIVHGHTPVQILLTENEQGLSGPATAPVFYAGGLCLGVDSAMGYFPEAGFITKLSLWGGIEEVITLPEGLFTR